jgi:hypothetical protein
MGRHHVYCTCSKKRRHFLLLLIYSRITVFRSVICSYASVMYRIKYSIVKTKHINVEHVGIRINDLLYFNQIGKVSINFSQVLKYKILRHWGERVVVFFNEDRRTSMRRPVVAIPFANASVKTSVKYVLVLLVPFVTKLLL